MRFRSALSVCLIVLPLFALSALSGCKSKPEVGNVLRLAQSERVKGLDPIYADDSYSAEEVSRAYEPLYQYHYLKRPYRVIPNLAESLPEISKDRKTFIIQLKKGVLFQDDRCFKATNGKGRELTAEDVIYSWKRLADPKLEATGWWIFDGKIQGLNEWREAARSSEQTDYSKEIVGLKALDRYTLKISLTQPSLPFVYFLAMPFSAVVPKEAVEFYQKDFNTHAVGTGPFRLDEFSHTRQVWLRNPTYRQELYPNEGEAGDKEAGLLADAGKSLPLVDKIVVEVYQEWQPMWLNFLSGKLDQTVIPKDAFAEAVTPGKELTPELKAKDVQLHMFPLLDVVHLTFNMNDPIVGKNKALRQALSLAWDAAKYSEIFFNGRTVVAQGPIPPGLAGYEPNFKNPYRQFNRAKARELLVKAGYPEGKGLPALSFLTTGDSTARQTVEYAAQMFKKIGVSLKMESHTWLEFQNLVRNREGQLWSYAWSADYPDPENFFQLFYSKNASSGSSSGSNDANYSNSEYDRLYEKILILPEGPQKAALYKRMVRLVVEDCPWIFQVHRMGFHLTSSGFKNYKPSAFYHHNAKYYRVERQSGRVAQ